MEKNLNFFIAKLSESNRKLSSLEKISPLPELSSSALSYCQRVINSEILLRQDYISRHLPLKQRKSAVYTGWDIHGMYRYLNMIGAPTTLTTSGQRSHRFISFLPATMMHQLYSHLLQLSAWDRRVFVNTVEELDTKMMHESYMVQNSSPQFLGQIWISSMNLMVTNQKNHQENGTANLR